MNRWQKVSNAKNMSIEWRHHGKSGQLWVFVIQMWILNINFAKPRLSQLLNRFEILQKARQCHHRAQSKLSKQFDK